ncbi:hypothetical protein NDU88_009149 [Pleurodeles waltl]|uniref:Uncharacterized protein n=1 Tax=Pleurodeles waltl TaxID=8319 RepID=A0AAV7NY81_PLEWA|nr:hypothetical protein NDU88_009149 [Pleurodeles waltl]
MTAPLRVRPEGPASAAYNHGSHRGGPPHACPRARTRPLETFPDQRPPLRGAKPRPCYRGPTAQGLER